MIQGPIRGWRAGSRRSARQLGAEAEKAAVGRATAERAAVGRTAIAVGSVLLLGACAPEGTAAQATIGGEWRDDVSAFAQRVVDAGLTPGAGVAVAIGDWVAWVEGFGRADMDSGRPVTDETQFYIASSTKSLTATAVALAAHRGDIDLEAPMVRYLPGARLPEGVEPSSVTVRDLLTLTHGLAGSGPIVLRTAYTGEFTRAELLELLRYHEPTGEKGTFDYNNLGYNLLGMVLEAVYDESWKEVVDRLVLRPLGMTSTGAYRSRLEPDRVALPHDFGPDGFRAIAPSKRDENLHAAGGHFASPGDLARYLAAHQSSGVLEGTRVLPAAPVEATHGPHVAQDRRFGPFHRHGWGYGWDLGTFEGDTIIHRFGGFAGYRSHMSFMPEHDIGVVVLVNGGGPASSAADLIATYAYERLLSRPDLEERYAARLDTLVRSAADGRRDIAAHLEERAARLAPLRHPLEHFAGTYESPVLGTMVWRVVAEGLEVRIGVLGSRAEVYDAAADQLRVELGGSGAFASFDFPEGGGPARAVSLRGVRFERPDGG